MCCMHHMSSANVLMFSFSLHNEEKLDISRNLLVDLDGIGKLNNHENSSFYFHLLLCNLWLISKECTCGY